MQGELHNNVYMKQLEVFVKNWNEVKYVYYRDSFAVSKQYGRGCDKHKA